MHRPGCGTDTWKCTGGDDGAVGGEYLWRAHTNAPSWACVCVCVCVSDGRSNTDMHGISVKWPCTMNKINKHKRKCATYMLDEPCSCMCAQTAHIKRILLMCVRVVVYVHAVSGMPCAWEWDQVIALSVSGAFSPVLCRAGLCEMKRESRENKKRSDSTLTHTHTPIHSPFVSISIYLCVVRIRKNLLPRTGISVAVCCSCDENGYNTTSSSHSRLSRQRYIARAVVSRVSLNRKIKLIYIHHTVSGVVTLFICFSFFSFAWFDATVLHSDTCHFPLELELKDKNTFCNVTIFVMIEPIENNVSDLNWMSASASRDFRRHF